MKGFSRGIAVAAIVAGASIGLAGLASAEPLGGSYNGLLTDGGGQVLNPQPISLGFAACGPDCTRMTAPGKDIELRLQGATWVGSYDWNGAPCTITVDAGATVLNDACPNEPPMRLALTKIG